MNPFDDPSQRTGFEDDDVGPLAEDEVWSSGEGEFSSEEPSEPRAGKRPRGASYGGKYPASRHWMKKTARARTMESNTDLAEYFGQVPAQQQVAICRAYASYLAAQNRGKTAVGKETSK